jgi:hypothetical protein
MLRDLARNALAVLLPLALIVGMAFVFGFTPDGSGQWPDVDEHPTNQYDTGLHP